MKDVTISENTTSIVDAKKIFDSISLINNKYEGSKKEAIDLIDKVNKSSEHIQKAKEDSSIKRKVFGFSSESLLELIYESNNAVHSSTSSISKLIQNNNENTKLLAEMISKLAMLSGLSFEKISETTAQLEEMAQNFEESSSGNTEQASQIKRVILAHINKIKEEKNKADQIEYNFGEINKLNENLKLANIENERKILLIEKLLKTRSEDHFIDIQNKQKKIINALAIFSILTFGLLVTFLLYYFKI
ncbi:hypothetical protein [Flavobacterium sp. FlaQc-48]|uniref:hypothetical protein n=1 Tax=Flavobacterium sp. FlaQc-48 TaxID=3374181 RepID=UPI003756F56B